jgi:hypothetical protein
MMMGRKALYGLKIVPVGEGSIVGVSEGIQAPTPSWVRLPGETTTVKVFVSVVVKT